ncbi:hypothetical protein Droror1_Dr00015490 [Drosera rotundifolia]
MDSHCLVVTSDPDTITTWAYKATVGPRHDNKVCIHDHPRNDTSSCVQNENACSASLTHITFKIKLMETTRGEKSLCGQNARKCECLQYMELEKNKLAHNVCFSYIKSNN